MVSSWQPPRVRNVHQTTIIRSEKVGASARGPGNRLCQHLKLSVGKLTTSRSWSACRRICNRDIVGRIQQVICFAFHDSNLLLETCREAKDARRIVTLFYLD